MTHDLLDDLLADVPRHVVADPARAWRSGTRRRRLRQAGGSLVVVAVLLVAALAFAQLRDRTPVQPAEPSQVVTGHPREVPRPFWEQDLPGRPGPVAGVLDTEDGWRVVDAAGRSWRLDAADDVLPSLSDDGTRLAFTVETGDVAGQLVTVDLTTGDRRTYEQVGFGYITDGVPETDQPFFAATQIPSYWSPDDKRLALTGGRVADQSASGVLVVEDGEVLTVPGRGFVVGWADPMTLVWLGWDGMTVRLTDLRGTVLRRVLLQDAPRKTSQWSGRVSPDGSRLAVLSTGRGARLTVHSLATGEAVLEARAQQPAQSGLVWGSDGVLQWVDGALRSVETHDELVTLSSAWGPTTFNLWAPNSASGPVQPGPGPDEWRYWGLWAHWPWLAVTAAALVGVLVAAALWWRRRRA